MSAQNFKYSILALSALALAASLATLPGHAAGTLAGWASLPAHTVAEGPTTGQFGGTGFGANSNFLPITYGQAVQGFSAVLHGPTASSFYVMPDNGLARKAIRPTLCCASTRCSPTSKCGTARRSWVRARCCP
ncbi:MAG: hypothetical protein RI920_1760 [Pseudomonadota bacterium]|jgi:hypothetical protein